MPTRLRTGCATGSWARNSVRTLSRAHELRTGLRRAHRRTRLSCRLHTVALRTSSRVAPDRPESSASRRGCRRSARWRRPGAGRPPQRWRDSGAAFGGGHGGAGGRPSGGGAVDGGCLVGGRCRAGLAPGTDRGLRRRRTAQQNDCRCTARGAGQTARDGGARASKSAWWAVPRRACRRLRWCPAVTSHSAVGWC